MVENLDIEYFIEPTRAGSYFTLSFMMPADTESFTLSYKYQRHLESATQAVPGFTQREEINIIDLGLISPGGQQVGASGSDKNEITISENWATPGYKPTMLSAGEWKILVGAYKVASEGLKVTYHLVFHKKQRRWLKGDLHAHTLASDGVLTHSELGWHARRHGLDFLAITDHNQMVTLDALPHIPDLTLLPGVEWTHYRGHANFIGADKPYDPPFAANSDEDILSRFDSANERGAFIMINHPFDEGCPFLFDITKLPFHGMEVWNGPMRMSNLRAVGFWHSLLAAGQRIPICGGSDYHRSTPFLFLGGPTTCVSSMSAGMSDILTALKAGHAYIVFAPDGPSLEMSAGDALLGDVTSLEMCKRIDIHIEGLLPGDEIKMLCASSNQTLLVAPAVGDAHLTYEMSAPGFARLEIWRAFLPGLPLLPALISNPIYFE
jgi:hypothetical protein